MPNNGQPIAYSLIGIKTQLTYQFTRLYQVSMTEQKTQKQREREAREERVAKALRDNLRRRKSAVRNRKNAE
ncbi:MAG: hypothetical protein COA43_01245 [Robiginitomaculum sp.]|nr:MAG: hypothetical protein COA43_01245 [Robiginitomaculum sp.]